MKMLKRYSVIPILFIAAMGMAQSGEQPLTLEQALELGKKNNLTLQQQQQRVLQANAELSVQKADFLPVFSVNGTYSYTSKLAELQLPFTLPGQAPFTIEAGVKNQYDLNATVQQPVFTGFRLRNQAESAREDMQQIKEQEQAVRNRILLQIYKIYYSAQLNLLQQQVLQSGLLRARDHLTLVKNLLAAEQSIPLDTMKVANQALSIQTQLKKLQYNYHIILTQLALVLNMENISGVEPFSAEGIVLGIGYQSALKAQAVQYRPELSQIKHQILAQQFRKGIAQSMYFPQVFAQASYHYAKPGVNIFKNEWMNYYRLGLNLQWKLWDWGSTRNQAKTAEYAIRIFDLQQKNLLESVKQEVSQAYQNLLSDREQIKLTRQLVAQEQERYRSTRDRFEQGLVTSLDLSDAEDSLTAAELQLQQSYINWLQNKAQLDYATGKIGNE
ncbi:MAG: TolC family protein [Calditrichia bacterium]